MWATSSVNVNCGFCLTLVFFDLLFVRAVAEYWIANTEWALATAAIHCITSTEWAFATFNTVRAIAVTLAVSYCDRALAVLH